MNNTSETAPTTSGTQIAGLVSSWLEAFEQPRRMPPKPKVESTTEMPSRCPGSVSRDSFLQNKHVAMHSTIATMSMTMKK